MPFPAMRAPQVSRRAAVESMRAKSMDQWARRYGRVRGEPKWVQQQKEWETDARAYARFNGVGAFNALVVSDMCSRCDLLVSERTLGGEWAPTEKPNLLGVLDEYENKWQSGADLVRTHSWRYQVDGHAMMAWWDGDLSTEYGVFSTTAVEVDKPAKGLVTLKLVVDGKIEEETALVVPRDQTYHVWIPDMEELLRPTSPMMSSIEDLHRYRALTRRVWRNADSHLAMDGILWFPSDVEPDLPPPEIEDEDVDDGVGVARTNTEGKYYDVAKLSYENNDDIVSVAPTYMSWDKDLGAPVWVKVGDALDPNSIQEREAAIADASRPWAVPTTSLLGGGVGNANHWSEWLASEKFVESGIKPTMDRLTHMDLTRVFLWPRLRFEGWTDEMLRNVRVDYDPAPVIIKPDKSDLSIRVHSVGGISYESLREHTGFDESDAPTPEDDERLLKFREGQPDQTRAPADPSVAKKMPPTRPMVPPPVATNGNGGPPSPVTVAAVLGAVLGDLADADAH